MALTRKFLAAMGIDGDKVDEIIAAHAETVDALKEERDRYKADAEKLPTVQKELDDQKKAAEGDDGKNPFETKYTELKQEFDDYKADVAAKEETAKKERAYRELLKEAGVSEKRIDTVLRVSDLGSIELDADGKIKGHDEMTKRVKTEWADFIVTESTQGAKTSTPPAGASGKTYATKEDIMKIKDDHERQVAIAQNHDLFGF